MKARRFTGVLSDMHQGKRNKRVGWIHTMFNIATNSAVDQKEFEKIIEEVALGKHKVEVWITTVKKDEVIE